MPAKYSRLSQWLASIPFDSECAIEPAPGTFFVVPFPRENMPMPTNSASAICRNILACTLLLTAVHASAQFVGNNSAAVEKRVNELVGAMTLDEKIDLINGDTPFRTHPVPRLKIPYFQMAAGPVGA